jgi:hypothetical protein
MAITTELRPHSQRRTIYAAPFQNAPCGFIETSTGKLIFAINESGGHAGDGSVTIKTATNEAAANAGTFSGLTTLIAEDATYYYSCGWFTQILAGANQGRIWMAINRATVATGPRVYRAGFIYSDDDGSTWSSPIYPNSVFEDAYGTSQGQLVNAPIVEIPGTDGQTLVVGVYGWNADGDYYCRQIRSTDGGATWASDGVLVAEENLWGTGEPNIIQVALENGTRQHICFYNRYLTGGSTRSIRYKVSTDDCATWGAAVAPAAFDTYWGAPAAIQAADGSIVVFLRHGTAPYYPYIGRSTDYGSTYSIHRQVDAGSAMMRYGQFDNLSSGRLGLCYATEVGPTEASTYWRSYTLADWSTEWTKDWLSDQRADFTYDDGSDSGDVRVDTTAPGYLYPAVAGHQHARMLITSGAAPRGKLCGTVKFQFLNTTNNFLHGPITKRVAANSWVYAYVLGDPGASDLFINKRSGSDTILATVACTAKSAATNYWLRLTQDGNQLLCEFFDADPFGATLPAPVHEVSYLLAGADATTYGSGITGYGGMTFLSTGSVDHKNDQVWFETAPEAEGGGGMLFRGYG